MFSTSSTRSRSSSSAARPEAAIKMENQKEEDVDTKANDNDDSSSRRLLVQHSDSKLPLNGAVICLTGMSASLKEEYHELIQALGGSFTRDFHTKTNTHLIAETVNGSKVDAALKATKHIWVVSPLWLKVCEQEQSHVNETNYVLNTNSSDSSRSRAGENDQDTKKRKGSSLLSNTDINHTKNRKQHLLQLLDDALQITAAAAAPRAASSPTCVASFPNPVFSSCQFYLVGFNADTDIAIEYQKLCKLISRGMGSIFWDYHENITHVIVHDQCDDVLRTSISKAKNETFGNHTAVVSPLWVVKSWHAKELLSPRDYPATLTVSLNKKSSRPAKAVGSKKHSKTTLTNSSNANKNSTEKSSTLLRGYIFVLLRLSNPPSWMVDYDIKVLEGLVHTHGGQILSSKLLDILKDESLRQQQQQQQVKHSTKSQVTKRKCHIICWGGNGSQSHLQQQQFALHPLLSQLQRKAICDLVTVTPNWIQTCVEEQVIVDPACMPLLFQPQPWPWRRLIVPVNSSNNEKSTASSRKVESKKTTNTLEKASRTTVRISVTGFVGVERQAVVQAIRATGAVFDDSMHQHKTTHLICADLAVSLQKDNRKMLKAREWNIPVMTLGWLYHILQYGNDKASEAKFAVLAPNDDGNGSTK